MKKITSHLLNGADGSHASDVRVKLIDNKTGMTMHELVSDSGGRLIIELPDEDIEQIHECQLVIAAGEYWEKRGYDTTRLINTIILQLDVSDGKDHHHLPVIMGPNTYSTWKSG